MTKGNNASFSVKKKISFNVNKGNQKADDLWENFIYLTANLGDLSWGLKASSKLGWNWIKSPPKRDKRSPKMSRASNCTETSSCWEIAEESRPTIFLQTEIENEIFFEEYQNLTKNIFL